MVKLGGYLSAVSALSVLCLAPSGDDEIGARLRSMAAAERHDPPDDSARAIRRRERNVKPQGSQVRRGPRR